MGPIFKGHETQDEADMLPRNVVKELPLYDAS